MSKTLLIENAEQGDNVRRGIRDGKVSLEDAFAKIDARAEFRAMGDARAELRDHCVPLDGPVESAGHGPLNGLLSDPQAPLVGAGTQEIPELRLFIRTLETAMADARGGGRGNDWVCMLEARDWIRNVSLEYLQEIAPTMALTATAFGHWRENLEEEWLGLGSEDDLVHQLDQPGRGIPVSLTVQYLLEIQYLTITGEHELARLNEKGSEILSSIKEDDDVKLAIHELAEMLRGAAPRIKHVGASAAGNADKLARLQTLVERRGLEH